MMLDEARRMKALMNYRILDTEPEPEFDRLAELVARVCDAPMASVSFSETHRHWHKARIGFGLTEVRMEDSICVHALGMSDLLVIEDLSKDVRTKDRHYVVGATRLRFYAGAQLRTPDGLVVGMICALDSAPRPGGLSPRQRESLTELARRTMALVWFRAEVSQRRRTV